METITHILICTGKNITHSTKHRFYISKLCSYLYDYNMEMPMTIGQITDVISTKVMPLFFSQKI